MMEHRTSRDYADDEAPARTQDAPLPSTSETPEPEDERSDLQQAVEARADAVKRGEGSDHPNSPLDGPSSRTGENGAGGVVKNQDDLQQ